MPFFEQGNVIYGADAGWYQPLYHEYRMANPEDQDDLLDPDERIRFSTEVSKMGDRPALSFVPFSTPNDWAKYNSPNPKSPGAHVRKFVPLGKTEIVKLHKKPGSCHGHYGSLRRPSIAQKGAVKGACSFRNRECVAAWQADAECEHKMSRDKLLLSCTHCYAKRGNYQPGLAGWAKAMGNWIEYLMDPERFKSAIREALAPGGCLYRWRIKTKRDEPPRFRWFVAGDCPDSGFFRFACQMASEFPDIEFWFPSQRWDLIYPVLAKEIKVGANPIPKNMTVRISGEYMDKHPLDSEHMERYISQDREAIREMMDVIPNLTTSVVSTEYLLDKWRRDYTSPDGRKYVTRQCRVNSEGKCGKCAKCFFPEVKTIVYPYIGSNEHDFSWLEVLSQLRRRKNIEMKPVWARSVARRAVSIKGLYAEKSEELALAKAKYAQKPGATLKERIDSLTRTLPRLVKDEHKKLAELEPQIAAAKQELVDLHQELATTTDPVAASLIQDRIDIVKAYLTRFRAWQRYYVPLEIKLKKGKTR